MSLNKAYLRKSGIPLYRNASWYYKTYSCFKSYKCTEEQEWDIVSLFWLPGIFCHVTVAMQLWFLWLSRFTIGMIEARDRHSPWKLGLASGECAQHFCIRDRNPEQAWGRLRGMTLRSGRTPFTTFTIMCRMLFSPMKQTEEINNISIFATQQNAVIVNVV